MYFLLQIPAAVGIWSDSRVYRGQVFPREIQDEAAVSTSTMSTSRPGTKTYISTIRSKSYSWYTTLVGIRELLDAV